MLTPHSRNNKSSFLRSSTISALVIGAGDLRSGSDCPGVYMRVHRFKNENPYADIEVFICVKGTGEEEFLRRDGNLMGQMGQW